MCALREIEQSLQLNFTVDEVVDGALEDKWIAWCHVVSVANPTFKA